MTFDIDLIQKVYQKFSNNVLQARKITNHPLTSTEKILYAHLFNKNSNKHLQRGVDYVDFEPDRVAMQDATAQMALLQFIVANKSKVALPTTVHADHLIQARIDGRSDLNNALDLVICHICSIFESSQKNKLENFFENNSTPFL